MSELIHTKLVVEVEPAKFLSLGFGDIACSEADVVCVSSFREAGFTPNSSIGAVDRALGRGVLRQLLDAAEQETEACTLVDLRDSGTQFKQLLVVWMGTVEQFLERRNAEESIQFGLQGALGKLRKLGAPAQIDITALGSQYGGLHRRRIFDLLVSWGADLFNQCATVNHLRLVSFNLDTFVDFFEALHRMKSWTGRELVFGEAIDCHRYGNFETDVATAIGILDQNPKQVLVICRTIVESVVRRLCQERLGRKQTSLFEDTKELHARRFLPESINSFFHTCRVLGNFANHGDEFQPSRRDAEAVMLLTLRIIEWFLGGVDQIALPFGYYQLKANWLERLTSSNCNGVCVST